MWLWAIERDIWLSAVHIPGVQNSVADAASRKVYATETEWKLDREVFLKLNSRFGPFDIDLFASRLNTQCDCFFAWKMDLG